MCLAISVVKSKSITTISMGYQVMHKSFYRSINVQHKWNNKRRNYYVGEEIESEENEDDEEEELI